MKSVFLLFMLPLLCFGQKTYVPDDIFENFLETHDASGNTVSIGDPTSMGDGLANNDSVFTINIDTITNLEIGGPGVLGVSDLTGIESFISLKELDCAGEQLTNLDVTQNIALEVLNCSQNQLTSLDLSQNTALKTLLAFSNQINNIDVSQCVAIETLDIKNNLLTNIDVSQNINLIYLGIINNQLSSLNLTNNVNLRILSIQFNQLNCLNLKNGVVASDWWGISANDNPQLNCVEVYDTVSFYALHSQYFDSGVTFSTNCNYPLGSPCNSASTNISEELNNISTYPNPSNNLIQIEIENYNGSFVAELYDFKGKLLETTNKTSLSLANYPSGIYLLKVAYGDRVEQLKVVKE